MSYASASVLVTFDASSCEASLNAVENINTYEKSKMPRGIERKIKSILYPHDRSLWESNLIAVIVIIAARRLLRAMKNRPSQ